MTDNQQLKFTINIPVNKIYTALKWVVFINIIFLFGTWLHHNQVIQTEKVFIQYLVAEFNFAKENVAASWYSSMLFFCSGITAMLCFWADMQRSVKEKGRILNFGWIVMAGIFIMLSFDEMGSFHEMIGETAVFKKAGGGKGGAGWYVFYGLVLAVGIFMIAFFVMKFRKNKIALLLTIIGVLLFLSNPFQEKFELYSWHTSANPSTWHRPAFFLLLEEGSEIFASFCFLYSFIRYAIDASSANNLKIGKALRLETTLSKNFIFYLTGLSFLLGLIMLIIHVNAWHLQGDDNGIPQNWPPSAVSFFAFVSSLFLYFTADNKQVKQPYLLLAFNSLLLSVYFGSNIYGFYSGVFGTFKYVILAVTLISGLLAIVKLDGILTKLLLSCWVLLTAVSIFTSRFYPAALGYLAVVFLITGLFLHYRFIARKNNITV